MTTWIQNNQDSYFNNPPTPVSNGKLLFADIHQGQQTPKVKNYLRRCKTQLGNIPGGFPGYVKVFKAYVRRLSEKIMEENLDDYVGGKIRVSEGQTLIKEQCGKAWESISRNSVVRGFKKSGLSTNVDVSENLY